MALIETQPKQLARSGPGYAYPMTGIALGSIFVSGILGGIFTRDMVTSTQHQHFPGAFVGWIFDLIAIAFVVPAAMPEIPTATPMVNPEAVTDDAMVELRQLAQLRDSGAITEAEFQAKKADLLNRI